ncbi:MAG TPA: universal stress protein [Anaerolineales bacterium]|nr:universal stress protein [Anaerolineales bacterium]
MKDQLIILDGVSDPEAEIRLGRQLYEFVRGRLVLARRSDRESDREAQEARIQSILSGPQFAEIQIEQVSFSGSWSGAILDMLRSGSYAVLILSPWLANRQEKFFSQEVLGRIIAQSPCPVAVSKGRIGQLRRILICDSGADIVPILDRFLEKMSDLASSQVEITILHVMSQMTAYPGVRGAQLRADAEELILEHSPEGIVLEHDLDLLDRVNPHPKPKIRHGLVVDEIMKETDEAEYDLIVIGAHRGEGWQRYLLQNIASEIVEKAKTPVMLIP